MFELRSYLRKKQEWIEGGLEQLLTDMTSRGRLADAMRYAVTAGGKRIRPILCAASAEAAGGADETAVLTTACALELIHTYSLIHDDLPAMDDDALRRGKPTCHIAFDEATAILAGDALLTLAFQALSTYRAPGNTPPEIWLTVIRSLAEAVGAKGMVEGQMRDVASEGAPQTLEDLESIHRLKTGALISASVMTGAALANATSPQMAGLNTYAQNIGMAFQVVDDILNVEGDRSVMGKAVGTDQARSKNTFPSRIGMAASKELAKTLLGKALHALSGFNESADALRAIASYIIERKK
jgi:geranylgeranyl diphosphate synthase, type II